MANKKTVALWILTALAVVSCGRKSGQQYDPNDPEKARQEQLRKAEIERAQHVADSLAKKSDSLNRALVYMYVPYTEIENLEYSKTLGGTMERELFQAARPIIVKTEEQIGQMFKDNDGYDGSIDYDDPSTVLREAFYNRVQKDDSLKKLEYYAYWDAWNEGVARELDWKFPTEDTLMIKTAQNNADQMINGAHGQLDAVLGKLERDWAEYYASAPADVRKNPGITTSIWSNDAELGYRYLELYQDTVRIEKDTLTLHIAGVDADMTWFLDSAARYNPVATGPNKWDIQKIIDNKVVDTKSVSDSAKWARTETFISKNDTIPSVGTKSCKPGFAEGGGLKVVFDVVTGVFRSKEFVREPYSAAEQHELDSLNGVIEFYDAQRAYQRQLAQQAEEARKHVEELRRRR